MKYLRFVPKQLFVNTRGKPIMAPKDGVELKPGEVPKPEDLEQQSEPQVEFLCELTTSPKFVEGLRGTASMDMPIKARESLRGQEGKAMATKRWALEDEHARRLKAAYDDFSVPPHIAQNYYEFGKAMDDMTDEDPLDKVPADEAELVEKAREVVKGAEEAVAAATPPGGLRASG